MYNQRRLRDLGIESVVLWLGLIAVLGGAIAAMPKIWKGIKAFFAFFAMFFSVPKRVEAAVSGVESISIELREHMVEEERMRAAELNMIKKLVNAVGEQSSEVFRQTTFASDVAFYEMAKDEDTQEWRFVWANSAWTSLTGMTVSEAAEVGWIPTVADYDRERVIPVATSAGEESEDLEVEFDLVNQKTLKVVPARIVASPLLDTDKKAIRYLGAINVLHGGLEHALKSGISAVSRQSGQWSPIPQFELKLNDKTELFDLVWANRAWEELTGKSVKSARHSFDLMTTKYAEKLNDNLMVSALAGEDIDLKFEIINASTAERKFVHMQSYSTINPQGRVSGYFGTIVETERPT